MFDTSVTFTIHNMSLNKQKTQEIHFIPQLAEPTSQTQCNSCFTTPCNATEQVNRHKYAIQLKLQKLCKPAECCYLHWNLTRMFTYCFFTKQFVCRPRKKTFPRNSIVHGLHSLVKPELQEQHCPGTGNLQVFSLQRSCPRQLLDHGSHRCRRNYSGLELGYDFLHENRTNFIQEFSV